MPTSSNLLSDNRESLALQPTGALDDVWVKLGDEFSGYFTLAPAQALDV